MLILVRHGRTEANAAGLLLGRDDPVLDEMGVAQAEAVAATLGGADRVVSSPLRRTRSTAERLAVDVELDPRWIEVSYGEWEGRPLGEVPVETWNRWAADPDFAPPGGESLAQLGVRVRDACEDLALNAADDDIVVVSHVSPIKAAVAWALGVSDEVAWHLYLAPASITRIGFRGRRPVLHTYNVTSHLPGSS